MSDPVTPTPAAALAAAGWKTIAVAVVVAVVGSLQAADWIHLIPSNPQAVGWITLGLGAVMAGLRALTDTSIFKTTSPAPFPPEPPKA